MPKKIDNEKELKVINHRLEVLEKELVSSAAVQEKQELLELKSLVENGKELTEEQEEYIAELIFWFENECMLEDNVDA